MVYVTGDVHFPIDVQHLLDVRPFLKDDDVLIVCGDMGLAWDNKHRTKKAIEYLGHRVHYNIAFVDGNHEHFPILDSFPRVKKFEGTVGKLSDKIFHLRRAERYNIEGTKILAFGGARSTDRGFRVEGESWFPEEEFSTDDEKRLWALVDSVKNFDCVITHEAPSFIVERIYPYAHSVGFSRTQQLLDSLALQINFKKWYFGHHHISRTFGVDSRFVALYDDVLELNTDKVILPAKKGVS